MKVIKSNEWRGFDDEITYPIYNRYNTVDDCKCRVIKATASSSSWAMIGGEVVKQSVIRILVENKDGSTRMLEDSEMK